MPISKIGSKALVDCSVAAVDIADNSITAAKLAGSIANAKLANSSVTINSTSVSLGASATINALDWQSVITADGSTGTTGVAGRGYFINTTSAAHTFTLPVSATRGDTIAIKDYAGTFATYNLTISRNGHNIQGVANNSLIQTNRASIVLVYADVTRGWEFVTESNVAVLVGTFISATGGTITTDGDYKVHSFTGDGSFVVSQLGNAPTNPLGGPTNVDYLVVAGGGGSGAIISGGGGAGGYRISPVCGLPITVTTYPITVGAGGASGGTTPSAPSKGTNGSNSTFSTITSTGGGAAGGAAGPGTPAQTSNSGGSGGGGTGDISVAPNRTAGSGNTPPTSPSQGNPGGAGQAASSGGGGGANASGTAGSPSFGSTGGNGGAGKDASPVFGAAPKAFYPSVPAPRGPASTFAGGGSGGSDQPFGSSTAGAGGGGNAGGSPNTATQSGFENTGGGAGSSGGGPAGANGQSGANGGKGIVLIRYKFQ